MARVAMAALIGGAVIVLAPSLPAHAATVTVTRTNDVAGGGCAATSAPPCSLRQAFQYANAHAGTTISIPPGTYQLVLGNPFENEAGGGDLDIRENTTVVGTGGAAVTRIVASMPDRVIDVAPHSGAIVVVISGVTVSGGSAQDAFGGGGLWVGGDTDLTISDSVFIDNGTFDARGGGGVGVGSSATTVLLERVRLQGNLSGRPAGLGDAVGGALAIASGSVRVVDSVFDFNKVFGANSGSVGVPGGAAEGGAIDVAVGASLQLDRSLLIRNEAHGGSNTTDANSRGGVARGGAVRSDGALTMTNSTVTKNIAVGGNGGPGVNTAGLGAGGGVATIDGTILNSTIADNSAIGGEQGGGRAFATGGGGAISRSIVRNTIVAGNHLDADDGELEVDLLASLSDTDGHNLFGETRGTTLRQPSNLFGTATAPLDAKLAVQVADNDGPTSTLALLPGSPAINAGDDAVCATGAGGVDQRGRSRPQPVGGHCDIGAFEYDFASSTIALTTSVNPSASGQAVTFSATVAATGGSPTGTVTIRDGAASIGGGTLAGGVVTVTTAALSPGAHSISATYEGDTIFAPSTATLTQNVGGGGGGGTGLQFFPLPKPVRLLDTRAGHQALVAPSTPLIANQPLALPGRFTVDGITVPSSALALVGNATVDNTAGVPAGFATLWPSGSPLPLASNLNFVPGTVRPNSFTVGLGADGQFDLLSNTGGDFIVDITGYYAPPSTGGLYFHPLAQPVRLLDTRAGATAVVAPGAALAAGQTLNVQGRFTSAGGLVPATAKALVGNATVDNRVGAPAGFATLYPGGTSLPPTSNLNFVAGTIAPNAFTVALGADGSFDLFSNTGGDFIIDVSGYYDDQPSGGLLFSALAKPVRELDTRTGFAAVVHPDAPVSAGTSSNLPGSFTGGDVTVPASATALVGNATVDNSINGPDGFATLYPGGGSLPLASNLNYTRGLIAPNAFVVGIGPDHTYNLFSQSTTNYIIDISGYFAPT